MRGRICWYLSILLSFVTARHIYHLARTYLPHILFVLVHIPTYHCPRSQRETSAGASSSIITIAAPTKFPCCAIWRHFVVFLSFSLELPVNWSISPFLYH
jgi:hypothetical protein